MKESELYMSHQRIRNHKHIAYRSLDEPIPISSRYFVTVRLASGNGSSCMKPYLSCASIVICHILISNPGSATQRERPPALPSVYCGHVPCRRSLLPTSRLP